MREALLWLGLTWAAEHRQSDRLLLYPALIQLLAVARTHPYPF